MLSFRSATVWATLLLTGLIVAGCSSAESVCLTSEVGEVCEQRGQLTADGLQPGSVVVVVSDKLRNVEIGVKEDGTLGGSFGFLSVVPLGDVTVSVQAVDADGTPIEDQLVVKS